jgi:hypothetical protein
MKNFNFLLFASFLATTAVVVPVANATTVQVLGAGSSAMWQTAAIGAFKDLAGCPALYRERKVWQRELRAAS